MFRPTFLSITDQVVEYLQAEVLRGRWIEMMPGKHQLAAELGINNKTVEAALRQLQAEGLLVSQGAGRKRLINPEGAKSTRALRVGWLLNEGEIDLRREYIVDVHHALVEAGHSVVLAPQSMTQLRFDVPRVAAMVETMKADAWVVCAGSREVLEWFSNQPRPAFALFGHRAGLPMAAMGPEKPPAYVAATRQLIALGHRRIVLLCRRTRRLPEPGLSERAFLETMKEEGIPVSEYNLPDWEESNAGFRACLEALFKVTAPTALIVDEAPYFIAAMQFLARQGIRLPGDVSMICTDNDLAFAHCDPSVACITWDSRPLVQRMVTWVANVSRGKADRRQTSTHSHFVPGGTVGPVRVR